MAKLPAKSTDATAADATIASQTGTGEAADAQTLDQGQSAEVSAGPTVIVKGPAKGRWRIGRHFTTEPTSIQAHELTEAQWLALSGDPELLVSVVDPAD